MITKMDLGRYPQVSHTHDFEWMVHWWVPKGNEGSQILKENVFLAHFLNYYYLLEKGMSWLESKVLH